MQRFSLFAISLVIAALGAACGGAEGGQPGVAAAQEAEAQLAVSRRTLADAGAAAARYGRENLGHYRDMTERDLRSSGLEAPRAVSVDVSSTHTSYCIRVTNRDLPSIHRWRIGTFDSRDREVSGADHCPK